MLDGYGHGNWAFNVGRHGHPMLNDHVYGSLMDDYGHGNKWMTKVIPKSQGHAKYCMAKEMDYQSNAAGQLANSEKLDYHEHGRAEMHISIVC